MHEKKCTKISYSCINTFVPHISSLLRQVERMNLIWDKYFAESLKNCTREIRGVGVCRKFIGNLLLPTIWMTFLRCSRNNAELFLFIKCSCKGNIKRSGSVNSKLECSYERNWSWDIVSYAMWKKLMKGSLFM